MDNPLAILATDVTSGKVEPVENVVGLFEMIHHSITVASTWSMTGTGGKQMSLLPTNEAAGILISATSKALVQYKALKASRKEDPTEHNEALRKRAVAICRKMLDYLRDNFRDEYIAKSVLTQGTAADVLFIDQMEVDGKSAVGQKPTNQQVAVKRLLLDNNFIKQMSQEYIVFDRKCKLSDRLDNKDALKENAGAVKILFGKDIEPDFLLRLMSSHALVMLVINCIKVYSEGGKKCSKVFTKVLNFATNEAFVQNAMVQAEVKKANISWDMIFLQQSCLLNVDCKEALVESVVRHVNILDNPTFAPLVVTLEVAAKDESGGTKKFNEIIFEKLLTITSNLNPKILIQFLDSFLNGENRAHKDPDIGCTVLLLGAAAMSKLKSNHNLIGNKTDDSKMWFQLATKTIRSALLMHHLEFEIGSCSSFSFEDRKEMLFDAKTLSKLVMYARGTKILPSEMFDVLFESARQWAASGNLTELKPPQKTQLRAQLLALWSMSRNRRKPTSKVEVFPPFLENELCENQPQTFEGFAAEIIFGPHQSIDLLVWENLLERAKGEKGKKSKVKGTISFQLKILCSERLVHIFRGSGEIVAESGEILRRLVAFRSPIITLLLGSLASEHNHRKIRKAVINCFEAALENPTITALSSQPNYIPLLRHLVDCKAAILAGHSGADNGVEMNIKEVMRAFIQEQSIISIPIIKSMIDFIIQFEVSGVFEPLLPFVSEVNGQEELELISKFGASLLTKLLKKKDPVHAAKALELLFLNFVPNIIPLVINNEECWKFLCDCLEEGILQISFRGEVKSISEAILQILSETVQLKIKSDDQNLLRKLFFYLIDLSGNESLDSQTLMAARCTVEAVLVNLSGLTKNDWCSKLFADKLIDLWGEQYFEAGSVGGRLGKGLRSTRSTALYGKAFINSPEEEQKWKRTLFLLENFLNLIKGVQSVDPKLGEFRILLKPLNVLLKRSLDHDELYDNSYTLDLLLSSIHAVVDLPSTADGEGTSSLNENGNATNISPELLVQCIRTCKTPDTKGTALLILAKQASSASSAEYVLHNSIPIFTFMGNHFLKIEAKSSFDVAVQAIDIIIPHIQRICLKKSRDRELLHQTSLSILNTFVDASSDMPPHRFKTFMSQLVRNLSSTAQDKEVSIAKGENYLWIMTLLLLKADSKRRIYTGRGNETESIKMTAEEKHYQVYCAPYHNVVGLLGCN